MYASNQNGDQCLDRDRTIKGTLTEQPTEKKQCCSRREMDGG